MSWTLAASFSRVGRTSLRAVTWGEHLPTTFALCERCYASHLSKWWRERRESRMGFSVWVDWRVLGGVLADVMSWVVCVW